MCFSDLLRKMLSEQGGCSSWAPVRIGGYGAAGLPKWRCTALSAWWGPAWTEQGNHCGRPGLRLWNTKHCTIPISCLHWGTFWSWLFWIFGALCKLLKSLVEHIPKYLLKSIISLLWNFGNNMLNRVSRAIPNILELHAFQARGSITLPTTFGIRCRH